MAANAFSHLRRRRRRSRRPRGTDNAPHPGAGKTVAEVAEAQQDPVRLQHVQRDDPARRGHEPDEGPLPQEMPHRS